MNALSCNGPVNLDVYDKRSLAKVQASIALIANTIAKYEPITLLASTEHHKNRTQAVIDRCRTVGTFPPTIYGAAIQGRPLSKNAKGELAIAHIRFNGWGDKQTAWQRRAGCGNASPKGLACRCLIPDWSVSKAGWRHDGAGTLLAHASCWANPNRNFSQ